MRVSIYQPRYFPQLHYFNRMLDADIFIFLDTAQYTKSLRQRVGEEERRFPSFQSDTPIKLPQGKFLLTVPVQHAGYSPLNQTGIDYGQHWNVKHFAVIKAAYKKAPYFPIIADSLKDLLLFQYETLAELNIASTLWAIAYLLGIEPKNQEITIDTINTLLQKRHDIRLKKILLGSKLGVDRPEGLQKGTEWTTAICLKVGATEYLHGKTAQENYMHYEYYLSHGITPVVQNWKPAPYLQQFEKQQAFFANLSILDLLCNISAKEALALLCLPSQ